VSLLATVAALTTAAVLLRAFVGKVRRPGELASTMGRLGVPRQAAMPAAVALIGAELAVAVAVLFRPAAALTQAAIVALALIFAAAGLLAMRLEERVACNCFGAGGGDLGMRQVILLIPWTVPAAILHYGAPSMPAGRGAALFAAAALAVAALEAMALIPAMREGRGDRRSAEEMYEWLPSY